MRNIWLLVLALVQLTIACQRELHLRDDIQHTQDFLLIPRQLEPFPPQWSSNEKILHTSISAASIETWSSYYTHGDHIAGRNKSMAEATAKQWTANGVPSSLVEYEVFLNYPKEQTLRMKRGNASVHEAQMHEDVLVEDETTGFAGAPPAFHGYSASGKVEAEYVYVGRGHKDDFAALKAANVSLTGKIALAKYGGPFRGVKVQNAEANGMIGVVIFTDPGDDGPQEAKGDAPYPKGPARQPSSVQRGSVAYINKYPGDPTTPGQASKPGVQRVVPSNLPKIPSIPISYRDAIPILKALDGHGTSGKSIDRGGWIGGLNTTYSTGPALGVTLSLTNIMEEKITPIWNVIGIVNGTNANETVIIGNHRDAWIIGGAADPNSGSAILVEMTKAFGQLLKTGWKPRRNIIFASWDAEEYALVGSTEWVEDHAPWLSATAISYLNIDIAVSGPLPGASSTPELRALALAMMQKTVYTDRTLLDAWNALNQFRPEDNGFTNLGSGSDYTAFLQLGISALDFGFDADRKTPVYHYHSNFDSFHWMKTRIDKEFSIHATAARFLALLTYHLADDVLLPLDMADWARNVNYYVRDLVGVTMGLGREYGDVQREINVTALDEAAKRVRGVADEWVERTGTEAFRKDEGRVRRANGKMLEVLRLFVKEGGLPGRGFYKNVLVAPNRDDGYKAQTLPASMESLEDKKLDECRQWNLWIAERLNRAAEILVV